MYNLNLDPTPYLGASGPRIPLLQYGAPRVQVCTRDYSMAWSTWHGEAEQFENADGSMTQNILLANASCQPWKWGSGAQGAIPVFADSAEYRRDPQGNVLDSEQYSNGGFLPATLQSPSGELACLVGVSWRGANQALAAVPGMAFSIVKWQIVRQPNGIPSLMLEQQWYSAQSDTNPAAYDLLQTGSVQSVESYLNSTAADYHRLLRYDLNAGLNWICDLVAGIEYGV